MVNLLKNKISDFITANKSNIQNWKIFLEKKILPKQYFNSKNNFLYENYIKEEVLKNKKEPDLLILNLIPFILEADLKFFINEGFSKNQFGFYFKREDNYPNNQIEPIEILFNEYSYHIVVSEQYYKLYKDYLYDYLYSEDNEEDPSNLQLDNCIGTPGNDNMDYYSQTMKYYCKMIEPIKDVQYCNICNENGEFICLNEIIPKKEICKSCFMKYIGKVMKKRAKNMISENFKFIEYYLRDIPLCEFEYQGNMIKICLTSIEFHILFREKMIEYLRKCIESTCFSCLESFIDNSSDVFHFECDCQECHNCFLKKFAQIKYKYMNYYERKNSKGNYKTDCGKIIDSQDYIESLVENESEIKLMKEESETRLKGYCEDHCLNCGIDRNSIDERSVSSDYGKKANTFFKYQHFICSGCNKELRGSAQIRGDESSFFVDCKICGEKHKLIFENTLKNRNDDRACSDGCIIF